MSVEVSVMEMQQQPQVVLATIFQLNHSKLLKDRELSLEHGRWWKKKLGKMKQLINDGMPCAMKVACTVWSRGKGRDYLKTLPIAILGRPRAVPGGHSRNKKISRMRKDDRY